MPGWYRGRRHIAQRQHWQRQQKALKMLVSTQLKIARDGAPPATVTGPARLRVVIGGRGAHAVVGYQQEMRGG